eukprot:COSAG06_NODE_11473_length_1504_cov_1.686121_3_plen_95_part_00
MSAAQCVQAVPFLLVLWCTTSMLRVSQAAARVTSCIAELETQCGADHGNVFDCAQCAGTHQVRSRFYKCTHNHNPVPCQIHSELITTLCPNRLG